MIRTADKNDIKFIYEFTVREARNGHFCNKSPRLLRNFFFKRTLRKAVTERSYRDIDGNIHPATVYIYEANGRNAGFFALIQREHGVFEIWLLGLLSQFRGKGVGDWLFSEAEKYATGNHPRVGLLVRTYTRSEAMLFLLKKHGYEKYSGDSYSGVYIK